MRIRQASSFFLLFLMSCGTITDFPVKSAAIEKELSALETTVTVVQLTADNIAQYDLKRLPESATTNLQSSGNWNYRVGVGDILDIVVWEHPELTMPGGEGRNPIESGLRVQADGTFFYPYVDQVQAKGLTPEAIRKNLQLKLADYIPNPQIVVRVVGYNSQNVSVTGEVTTPNRQALNAEPLTLLQAVDAAGGLTEDADSRRVTVRRGGKLYSVDLKAFLDKGEGRANPTLVHGDIVNVPKLEPAEVFLLGQIVKPSTIDLTREDVTLTQALTRVGGLREGDADARGVFVFRNSRDAITVYQLDAANPVAFVLGTRFTLLPQDLIYVTTAPISKWNQIISRLLPSVAAYDTVQRVSGTN